MQPDLHEALVDAITKGPSALSPSLLAGSEAAQFRGLRAHANTISHSRYVALEDSFPQTRSAIGTEAFHELATRHVERKDVCARALRHIGHGFAELIVDPVHRNLARREYAALEASDAANAPALSLPDIAGMTQDALLALEVDRHPAVRLVVDDASDMACLISRSDQQILVTEVTSVTPGLLDLLPCRFGQLLGQDEAGAAQLLQLGALCRKDQQ